MKMKQEGTCNIKVKRKEKKKGQKTIKNGKRKREEKWPTPLI